VSETKVKTKNTRNNYRIIFYELYSIKFNAIALENYIKDNSIPIIFIIFKNL